MARKTRGLKVKVFPCCLNFKTLKGSHWKESRKGCREEETVSVLAIAIERRQWELAALCLVLGLLEAVSKLPADAIIGLFDVLDGGEDGSSET